MYIVYNIFDDIEKLRSKYLLLELDTVEFTDQNKERKVTTAYAVIDKDNINLPNIATVSHTVNLHEGLVRNYQKQNWSYCEEAIKHLHGVFDGYLDSYYDIMSQRIAKLKTQKLEESWDGRLQME